MHLPNVGMVIPDLCNDAHDCDLSDADAWFRGVMRKVFAGPDWKSGRLAVVLTADEDEHDNQGNTVLTMVLHGSQQARVVDTPLTHYSLSGLLSAVTGTRAARGGPHRTVDGGSLRAPTRPGMNRRLPSVRCT